MKLRPTVKTIATDLDAFDLYTLFKDTKEAVILDSGMHNNGLGKLSIIGIYPIHNFKVEKGKCFIDGKRTKGKPFELLEAFTTKYEVDGYEDSSFIGGAIGYLGYEMGGYLEKLPSKSKAIMQIPDCYFNIYEDYIVVNHDTGETQLIVLGVRTKGEAGIKLLEEQIREGKPVTYEYQQADGADFRSPFTKESYEEAVELMRQYIKKGHIYIANMTHTFTAQVEDTIDSYQLYKALRHINPAPFAAYLPFDGFSVLSSSPERFLKLDHGKVITRPIKGTRPRSEDPIQDKANQEELLASEKDKSELLMVVDLERNDLSKVCQPHSVKVTELFKLETYPTVHHLVSNVEGRLEENYGPIDLVKATFPGGSITGTPKIRAMEVIDELEANKRHIYTGSIGYIGFNGNMDLNIVIRTMVMEKNKIHLGVGGGITWESDPEEEYYETLAKAKAPFRSLSMKEVVK